MKTESSVNLYHFKERDLSRNRILLYLAAILIIGGLPLLWLPVHLEEARLLIGARGIAEGFGSEVLLDGEGHFEVYPLWAMVLAGVHHLVPAVVWTSRLLIWLITALTVCFATLTAARSSGLRAGAAAGAISMGCIWFILAISGNGNDVFGACLLFWAWILWYRSSRILNRPWVITWLITLFPVWLAVFAVGMRACLIFYLPLLFTRRPLRARLRLVQWEHYVPFILYWVLYSSAWRAIHLASQAAFIPENGHALRNWFDPQFSFWWLVVVGTLPMLALLWPVFCVKFTGQERTPVFFSYMKTILVCTGFLLVVTPASPAESYYFLLVWAVAAGLHYDLLVKRYYYAIFHFEKWLHAVVGLGTLVGVISYLYLYFQQSELLDQEAILNKYIVPGLLVVGGVTWLFGKLRPHTGLLACRYGWRVVIIGACVTAFSAMLQGTSILQQQWEALQHSTAPLVYNELDSLSGYSLAACLKSPIQDVDNLGEVPLGQNEVWLLSTQSGPSIDGRFDWQPQLEVSAGHEGDSSIYLWNAKVKP